MAGGIQPGTTAWDEKSLRHDRSVRVASERAYNKLREKYPRLVRYGKLPREYLYEGVGACSPDGGVWFYEGELIAAFEAKKQGNNNGNAIERWYKNYDLIRQVNPRRPLVTYAMGEGVRVGWPIHRILYSAHRGEYNVHRDEGPSCFLQEEGFTLPDLEANMITFVEREMQRKGVK
jgi:hypothetical protein